MRKLTQEEKDQSKLEYEGLDSAGMLYEFFPTASGIWETDKHKWYDHFSIILDIRAKYSNKVKRDYIPVCTVHNRFQTQNGRWLNVSEDYHEHVVYTCSQDHEDIESPCDKCDDPRQIDIDYEEL